MDQPISPTPPVLPQVPVVSALQKKSFTWLYVLLIVFSLGVAAFFGYQYWQLKQQVAPVAKTQASVVPSSNLPSPSTDPIADWKTYTDPNGIYSFKYPPEYQLGHYGAEDTPLLLNKRIEWGITQYPAGSCRGDCPIIEKTDDFQSDKYMGKMYEGWIGSIGGDIPQSYVKAELRQPGNLNNYLVIMLWELDRTATGQQDPNRKPGVINDVDRQVFDRILASVQFIDGGEYPMDLSDYNGWETYTNVQYGFKLQYPPTFKALTDKENLYGWPNAVVLFYDGGQSYDLPVEVWDSEAEYQEKYQPANYSWKVVTKDNKFITLVNMNNDPIVDKIMDSFKFTD